MSLTVVELFEPADGGVPVIVRTLAHGLARRGVRVIVAGPPDAVPRAELEATPGVTYHALEEIVPDMVDGRRDARTLVELVRLLRSARADIIHAHSLKAGLLGRLAAPVARVASVYSTHCFDYRSDYYKDWPGYRRQYVKTLWMERVLGRLTTAFLAISEDERLGAIEDRLLSPARMRTIYYGVEYDASVAPDPPITAFRGDGPLLGFVAGLRNQKGLPTLLAALELLHERGRPLRFAIVGSGPLEGEVRARVEQGPLRETTLLHPFTPPVERYLNALDGFVLPSYWEGLPIAVLEAMHAGLPVIASDVGGTAEGVVDGETGFIVAREDAEGLADRMEQLAGDAALRERMGAAGRARARERYAPDRMVDETLALYEACAGRPRPRRLRLR